MIRKRNLSISAVAGMIAASFGSAANAQVIGMLNRSHEPPLSPKGFSGGKRKADKTGWSQSLRKAESKSRRGGGRPVSRGR